MKRSIFIVILLIWIAISGAALEIHGKFQVGHNTQDEDAFTHIYLEAQRQPISIYGSWRTWFVWTWPLAIDPFRDIYEVGLRLTFGVFFADVNHFCNHPVWSGNSWDNREDWLNNRWGEDITTLSVGIQW